MDDKPEVIRQKMEETRSQLAEKLEALESQVSDTVQNTTDVVTETVEAVKETVEKASETVGNVTETVQETVQSVSETFSLQRQAERHPWIVFGGSVALGYLLSNLFDGSRKESRQEETGSAKEPERSPSAAPASTARNEHHAQESSSWAQASTQSSQPAEKSWLWDEVGRLKGLALGSLMGVVRELTSKALPESIGKRVAEEVDHLTTSIGGEKIQGSILPQETPSTQEPQQSRDRKVGSGSFQTGKGVQGQRRRLGPPHGVAVGARARLGWRPRCRSALPWSRSGVARGDDETWMSWS
jgi:ElaB/YqjD/DUF883 family membrane-anchored ribosome-binding protein